MQRHLLLTMGDDAGAFNKLRFVRFVAGEGKDTALTLFYVSPSLPEPRNPGAAGDLGGPVPECDPHRGREVLARARRALGDMGVPEDKVFSKVACSVKGTSGDIVTEAEAGLYDAVVVGRRGLSWFEELVTGSVSTGILNKPIDFPVWICANPEYGGAGVLLCVDGSKASLRMADHVGFMMSGEDGLPVTVLHVARQGYGDGGVAGEAARLLLENGVPDSHLSIEVVSAPDADAAIIERAGTRAYSAVAVGMSQDHGHGLGRVFSPNLGFKLCDRLGTASVWISK